jgi:hypothetical protein
MWRWYVVICGNPQSAIPSHKRRQTIVTMADSKFNKERRESQYSIVLKNELQFLSDDVGG